MAAVAQLSTAADVPISIKSDNSASERRISPSWTISHLKARLEPVTGIPAGFQKLRLSLTASHAPQLIEAIDEDTTQLAHWSLQPYAEIFVVDTRPPGVRENYTDVSAVEHYTMSTEDYEARTDSVLAWKKAQSLGRFAPDAPTIEEQKRAHSYREVSERHIVLDARCRLLPESDHRRGSVKFIGDVAELPGIGAWVGVRLDEPTGKNAGRLGMTKYFESPRNHGVFVRPERVEVGNFSVLDELADDGNDDEF